MENKKTIIGIIILVILIKKKLKKFKYQTVKLSLVQSIIIWNVLMIIRIID